MLINAGLFCGLLCVALSSFSGKQMSRMVSAKTGETIPAYRFVQLLRAYEEAYGFDANSLVFRLSTLGTLFFMLFTMIISVLYK